jgi:hypothetical protein
LFGTTFFTEIEIVIMGGAGQGEGGANSFSYNKNFNLHDDSIKCFLYTYSIDVGEHDFNFLNHN